MISSVVLTHNDEATVAKTLESLTWCEEIIVVDDASTDTTVAIAKNFTNKIFQHPLNGDFAAQRNFGLSKAKEEWVLFVDSDEVVTDALAKEIKERTSSKTVIPASEPGSIDNEWIPGQARNDKQYSGYYIKRNDSMWGRELRYGEQGNMKLLRLAKKDAGQWERPVHEVWKVKGNTGELQEQLHHFPHPSVAQYLEEINRYSSINASYLYKQRIRVHWWHIVAYPVFKFFLNYIIRLGFLDGTPGAVVAIMMSMHSFLTRAKLWQLWDKHA